jgi:Cu/Ag efflux protein CusF
MPTTRHHSISVIVGVLLCALVAVPAGTHAQQNGKKAYVFKGKVEKVDEKAKTLTIANENIPGWMTAMTMAYGVDKDTVLRQVKAGDQITATVYDGDFTLHNVKVVPPEKKK